MRRGLGLPSPREYFAAEYNVPDIRLEPLRVECDPERARQRLFLGLSHTRLHLARCGGAEAPGGTGGVATVPGWPARRPGDRAFRRSPSKARRSKWSIEGCHFPGGVHLAGDAAGLVSSLTAEGIYAALVTGEEVARQILEPRAPAPKTARWLRTKRRHDRLARWLRPVGTAQGHPGRPRSGGRASPHFGVRWRIGSCALDRPPRALRRPRAPAGCGARPGAACRRALGRLCRVVSRVSRCRAPRGLSRPARRSRDGRQRPRSGRGGHLVP